MRYVNAAQAARMLGIGDKTIRRWLKEGKKLPGAIVKANGEYAIPENEVEELKKLRSKFAKDDTTSHDQTDISQLAAKLAALEQEVADLRKSQPATHEQEHTQPTSEAPIVATSKKKVSQNRSMAPSEDIPEDLPSGTIKLWDFIQKYGLPHSSVGRWVDTGLKGEKVETVIRTRTNGAIQHYLTPEQHEKALEILKRHGKLKNFSQKTDMLATDFAKAHGVDPFVFEGYMREGLGPGLIGYATDTIPQRDQVDYSERPKPNRPKEKEKYLTQQQQQQTLEFWKRHDVAYAECNNFGCWCHQVKNGE